MTVKRCPYCVVMETPQVLQLMKLYRFFRMGLMPFPGGALDQPAPMMQGFQILEEIERWQQQAE